MIVNMNRQELRRKNRKKSKTYTLTSDQIATMTKEIEEKAYNTFNSEFNKLVKEQAKECTMQAFQQTFYIPLLVLRNMGWGKKRLTRFAEELINQYEMYEEKLYSSSDVKRKEEFELIINALRAQVEDGKDAYYVIDKLEEFKNSFPIDYDLDNYDITRPCQTI